MPRNVERLAPTSAPMIRAVSVMARDMPTAPPTSEPGLVSPMSQLRITRSLERTMPISPARRKTRVVVSAPVKARMVRSRTEPVWTMTNHPRVRVSISKAHDVRRSAGSWKRKLRRRKTLRINGRGLSSSRCAAAALLKYAPRAYTKPAMIVGTFMPPSRVFYGWWITVAFSFMVFVSAGVRHAVGPFLKPMTADLGVDRAAFSLVIALGLLLYGLFMPWVGSLVDRFGPRIITSAGSVLLA